MSSDSHAASTSQGAQPRHALPSPLITEAGPTNLFPGKPYLTTLHHLQRSYPALKSFLRKLGNEKDEGRTVVRNHFRNEHHRGPGRCFCLVFGDDQVSLLPGYEAGFVTPERLEEYLTDKSAEQSRNVDKQRRLFILEDMEPAYVEVLGHHLGVDPLVFSEQMNTWNYNDSWSVGARGLPSLITPEQSFTLRYYELRTLKKPQSIDALTLQMTFAVNRRRYERWRDVDVPSAGKPDRRHGFVRRAASFWTSQQPAPVGESDADRTARESLGWDAAILVDPAMAAACRNPQSSVLPPEENTSASARGASTAALLPGGGAAASGNNANGVTARKSTRSRPRIRRQASTGGDPGAADDEDIHFPARKTFILKDQNIYTSRASLWRAQDWNVKIELDAVEHESWPYLDGCATLMPLKFPHVGMGSHPSVIEFLQRDRDLVSPAEEMIFYWTNIAPKRLVQSTKSTSSNASYYLLKHVAQHWVNQLELINTTISKGEWFSDDYQAKIDDNLSLQKWKQDLKDVNSIAKDINYMRRHLNHFWRAMILNLERVGVTLGCEEISEDVPLALKGAQKDFITIHNRMQPLRERAEALNSVANDLANLRAAFRGVHDGEFSVRLSLFASIVFPLTLVAGIFSMSEDYLPGTPQHWKLWAIGLPVCLAVAMGLVYGKRPWRIFIDGYVYGRLQLRKRGLLLTAQEQQQWDSNKAEEEALKVNHHRRDVKVNARSETRVVRVAEDDLEGQAAAGARR